MNKRFIEELIPKAIDLIEKNKKINIKELGGVPNEFNAYISSLGTSLSQAGLRQSIIFYAREDHGAKYHREEIVNIAGKLLNTNLKEYVKSENISLEELANFKPKLIDTIIAIKMAIRSFKMVKK